MLKILIFCVVLFAVVILYMRRYESFVNVAMKSYPISENTVVADALAIDAREQLRHILQRVQTTANARQVYRPFNANALPVTTLPASYDEIRLFVEYVEEVTMKLQPLYEVRVKDTGDRVKMETDYETHYQFVIVIDFVMHDDAASSRTFTNLPITVAVTSRQGTFYMDKITLGRESQYLQGLVTPQLHGLRSIHDLMDIDPLLVQNAIQQKKREHEREMQGRTSDINTYENINDINDIDYNQVRRQIAEIGMVSDKNILQFQRRKDFTE